MIGLVTFYTVRLTNARNAAVTEAARAQRIQRLMLNLFTGGEEAAGPAEDLRVVTLIDRGVLEAQNLNAEPAVQAEMYRTLGGIYQKLGNFSKAESLLQTALDQRRSLFGPDSAEVAESLVALGLLRVGQAKFDEAERLVREGLAMSRRHLAARRPVRSRAPRRRSAWCWRNAASYKDAIAVLEEAARLHSARQPASADLAATLRELVNTHFYAGNLTTADEIGRRVLAMTRQVNGESPCAGRRRPDQPRRGPARTRTIHRGRALLPRGARDHRKLVRQGALQDRVQSDDARAIAAASEAVRRSRRPPAPRRGDSGACLRAEASAGRVRGQRSWSRRLGAGDLDEAEAAFTRMADIYRSVYGTKHYLIGIAISNLASVYVARKDYRRAEPLYREAIALYVETQSPQHMNTGIGRIKLGRALVGQQRYAEAERELLTGYEILTKQTSPSVSWLRSAREDLVKLYKASDQPEKARQFEAESGK